MKKTIAVILLASVFTLYGCAATASDNGSSVSDTSAPAENTAENTVVTTEATPEKALEDAKTVGEALEILYPDITFDVDNIVSLFIDSDMYDDKYASVEDDETIADILDTLRNAPVVKCESKQAVPGAPAQIKFNDGDGRLPVTATVEESAVVFDYGAYVLTVNDGYFTELCHFIDTVENVSEAASTDTAEEPMSYDDYLGIWHLKDNDNNADEIIISGITSEKVDFQFGLFREFGFHTTAIAYDNVYYFGEQYGSDGSLPEGISGRIVFEDGAITITFDSFGVHEKIHYSNIMEYTFTEKTMENFDWYLNYRYN